MKRSFCQPISILHIFIVLDPSWDWKQKYGNIIVNSHLTQLNSNSKQVTSQRKKGEKIKKIKSKKPLQDKKISIYHLKYFVNDDTVHLFFITTVTQNTQADALSVTSTACPNPDELEVAPNIIIWLNTFALWFCLFTLPELSHDRGEKLHPQDHSGQDYGHLGLSAHQKF